MIQGTLIGRVIYLKNRCRQDEKIALVNGVPVIVKKSNLERAIEKLKERASLLVRR